MTNKGLRALIVINAVLLMALSLLVFSPSPAEAQLGPGRGGDYIMVAGRTPQNTHNTIYIIDLNSGGMMAVEYSSKVRTASLKAVAYRDLNGDGGGGK